MKRTIRDMLQPREAGSDHARDGTIPHDLLVVDPFINRADYMVTAASLQRIIELCSDESLLSADADHRYPLHKAVMLYEENNINFRRVHDVIRILV